MANLQVRDKKERWIRCALEKGDFLILPPGIYHRFTPGETNFTHAIRLFKDFPKWTAFYRKEGGEVTSRAAYLKQVGMSEKEDVQVA
jgi:1,2-dihydroxy-3-keto-5-methylthiopentene dioxygenase